MKKILFSLFTILFLSGAISQTEDNTTSKAIVTSEITNDNTIQYTFISNLYISEYKAPMLEGRLLNRYPEIIDIKIDSESQMVVFKTPIVGSTSFLDKFITHFKYSSYEIH